MTLAVYTVIYMCFLKTIIYMVVANVLLLNVSNVTSGAVWSYSGFRPCSHSQFYPTNEPFANGTRPVHTASTASGSSGTLKPI